MRTLVQDETIFAGNWEKKSVDVSPEQLAREFSNSLKKILSRAEIVELVRRNREEISPNICHSHDFCDANMVLHEVFIGHGMDIADEGGRERWGVIWDATWNLAKSREFWVDK